MPEPRAHRQPSLTAKSLILCLIPCCLTAPLFASDPPKKFKLGVEARLHFRDSEDVTVAGPPPAAPPVRLANGLVGLAQPVHLSSTITTVDAGTHAELSLLTFYGDIDLGRAFAAHAKVDVVDRYDRNPTSTDRTTDIDELWIRFGPETQAGLLPQRSGVYVKLGKMPKFERQNDRHLESYGLVSTVFNRMEDVGAELGIDFGRHFYLKASLMDGNPVWVRDPHALAGDNGPDPPEESEVGPGFGLLYDAEVEDLSVHDELEVGAGLGLRFGNASGTRTVDVLLFSYERDLEDTIDLRGTIYPGDLDLLDGPVAPAPLPLTNDQKTESGLNLRLRFGGLSVFSQYVDQELGGMKRTGLEAEIAWTFDLPLKWSIAGRQLFPYIAPAIRYSELRPEFEGGALIFPFAATRWDWDKIDVGIRIGLVDDFDLTLESSTTDFLVIDNDTESGTDEFLITLRARI